MPKPCRWWTGGVDSCIAIFFLFGSRDRRNMSTGLGLPGQGHRVLVTLYWKHRFVFLIYLSMTSVSNYIWSKNTETKVQFQFRCLSIQRLINWLIVSHLNLLIRYQLIICQENLKQGLTNNIYENHDSFYQQQKVPSRSCLINSLSRGYRAACLVRPKLENHQGDAALALGQAAAQDLGCPVRYCAPVCQPESISSLTRRGEVASAQRAPRRTAVCQVLGPSDRTGTAAEGEFNT